MAFSQKPMLRSKFLYNLPLLCVKNANFFAIFFGENIFKTTTSVPELGHRTHSGHPDSGARKMARRCRKKIERILTFILVRLIVNNILKTKHN
jgi:hypothetical protein